MYRTKINRSACARNRVYVCVCTILSMCIAHNRMQSEPVTSDRNIIILCSLLYRDKHQATAKITESAQMAKEPQKQSNAHTLEHR